MDLTQFIEREDEHLFPIVFTSTPQISECLKKLRREALSNLPNESAIHILGEPGVGKERLAQVVHQGSKRSQGPWIVVNCALGQFGTDEVTLKKEFLGEEKQEFQKKCILKGIFELAQGGTLYLKQVDQLLPCLQDLLLKSIESKKFTRVGGTESQTFDVRMIFDSLPNVQPAFSKKLAQAQTTLTLEIPALRERPQEILPIAKDLANHYFKNEGKHFQGFTPESEKALSSYLWPGNVHELIYLIKRSALLTNSNALVHLNPSESSNLQDLSLAKSTSDQLTYAQLKKQWSDTFEKNYIMNALRSHQGNVSAAAREAKLDRSNFLRLMRRHGIKADLYRTPSNSAESSPQLRVA